MLIRANRRNGAATVGKRGPERQGQPKKVRDTPAGLFGQRLEKLMIERGLTTEEFAEAAGLTSDAIRKYLRGVSVPHINRWPELARALGLNDAAQLTPKIPV